MNSPLYIACEGSTDVPVLKKIAEYLGFNVLNTWSQGGAPELKKKLPSYNNAALNNPEYPWFVVLDLDQKKCAVQYARECLPESAPAMIFRIAVQEIESWIMADREHFSKFFHVPIQKIPFLPDEEVNPKEKMIQLIKEYCGNRSIKKDMIPMGTAKIGRGYGERILCFFSDSTPHSWRLEEAEKHSKSLKKTVQRLSELFHSN